MAGVAPRDDRGLIAPSGPNRAPPIVASWHRLVSGPDCTVGPRSGPDCAVGPRSGPDCAVGPRSGPDCAVGPRSGRDCAVTRSFALQGGILSNTGGKDGPGRSARILGVICSLFPQQLKGSTRVPPGFHQISPGFYQGSTCCWGYHLSFFFSLFFFFLPLLFFFSDLGTKRPEPYSTAPRAWSPLFKATGDTWKTIVCWYLQGNRIIPWFLRWCVLWISSIHSTNHLSRQSLLSEA